MKQIFSLLLSCLISFNAMSQLNDTLVKEINQSLLHSIGTDAIVVTSLQMSAKPDYDSGYSLNNAMKFEEANAYFMKAIAIDSTGNCGSGLNGTVYTELGYSFSRLKKYDSAFYFLNRSMQINPTFPKAYINLTMLLLNQKKYNEGIKTLDLLLDRNPDFVVAYVMKGLLNNLEGNKTQAMADLNLYLTKVSQAANVVNTNECKEYVRHKLIELESSIQQVGEK